MARRPAGRRRLPLTRFRETVGPDVGVVAKMGALAELRRAALGDDGVADRLAGGAAFGEPEREGGETDRPQLACERRLASDDLEAFDAGALEPRERAQAARTQRVAAARLAAAVVERPFPERVALVEQVPSSNAQPSLSRNASHSSPGIAVCSISASVMWRGRITRETPRVR